MLLFAVQATTNGNLIHSGIAEKLGLCVQALATFIAAFVVAFTSQWKLTLILIWCADSKFSNPSIGLFSNMKV